MTTHDQQDKIFVGDECVGRLHATWNNDRWWAMNEGHGQPGQPTVCTRVHFTSPEDAADDLVSMLERLGMLDAERHDAFADGDIGTAYQAMMDAHPCAWWTL